MRSGWRKVYHWVKGGLQVIKQDKDDANTTLSDVEIKVTGPNNYQITQKTDEEGSIFLENIEAGTYTIEEIDNKHYGYKPEATGSITVKKGAILSYELENQKHTGNLKLTKKDKASEKTIGGFGFKVRSIEGDLQGNNRGKYIIPVLNSSAGGVYHVSSLTYTDDIEKATEFFADEQGNMQIHNLLEGNYEVIETSIPDEKESGYYGYEIDDDYITWQSNGMSGSGRIAKIKVERQQSLNTSQDNSKWTTQNIDSIASNLTIINEKKYTKLSGYVWLDKVPGKSGRRNNLFNQDNSDAEDLLFNGIEVRLKYKQGENFVKDQDGNDMKKITTSLNLYQDSRNNGNGEYEFEKVLIRELDKYYIEFEYDGLIYTNVNESIDGENTSKAKEATDDRTKFNQSFAIIEGATRDTGIRKDANGGEKRDLEYNVEDGNTYQRAKAKLRTKEEDYEETQANRVINLHSNAKYPIKAKTKETGYELKDNYDYEPKSKGVRYINLGIYEREQPEMIVTKDIESVKVAINQKEHTYLYKQKAGEKDAEKRSDKQQYRRAIYKSDYEYNGENPLEVYVTYSIRVDMVQSKLKARINQMIDYYDARYEDVQIGTRLNEQGIPEGNEIRRVGNDASYGNYKKLVIDTRDYIILEEGKDSTTIYVRGKLNKDRIKQLCENNEKGIQDRVDNVAEIASYSIFDESGAIYAGIHKSANPGNTEPGNESTYESDTDSSPKLLIDHPDPTPDDTPNPPPPVIPPGEDPPEDPPWGPNGRMVKGKVFEDLDTEQAKGDKTIKAAKIRQGNGQYDEGIEDGVGGVKVTLVEVNKNGNIKPNGQKITTYTNQNGDYTISGYIPGDYMLIYTWGDGSYQVEDYKGYNVQDYKGTVYIDEQRHNNVKNNPKWWHLQTDGKGNKIETAPRLTDAMDNYQTRQEIDAELKTVNTTKPTIQKMESSVPCYMDLSVEYDEKEYDASTGDSYDYIVDNIDFGIIQRARQRLEISKVITRLKVIIANGQVLVDARVDANREIQGDPLGVTFGRQTNNLNGFIKAEVDSEIIQGATVEIEYSIKVENTGEVDYDSQKYYQFGIQIGEIVKLKPQVYDYLDSMLSIGENSSTYEWKEVSSQTYNETYKEEEQISTMVEKYYNSGVRDNGTHWWEKDEYLTQVTFENWREIITNTRKKVRSIKLDKKQIVHTNQLEVELKPGERVEVPLYAAKLLSNTDEVDLNNDVEITEVERDITQKTGTLPKIVQSHTYDSGETATVTPPTGQNRNVMTWMVIGITSLILLGAGVVIIKKKVILG